MSRLTRPADAPTPEIGVVHLGLGAFSRAFVAIYIQEAMALSGGDWGIIGVSLKSPTQRDRLAPQGGAYTAVELAPEGITSQIISVVQGVLVAPESPRAVLNALERAKLVTLTVTEKGYCHSPATGRLNFDHPDIIADLADPDNPASAVGFITRALAVRRTQGRAPFTVLSCDNIPENGVLLRGLVLELAAKIDPDLAAWITTNCVFPSSMVDRIVPATTEADLASIEPLTGYTDAAPVMHEPFRQWVIEDNFIDNERPDFGAVGVQMVADVTPYEHMKLRCLNGTHSSLAYIGYLAGAEMISDVVARPKLAEYARHLWANEIIPVLDPPAGVDLAVYAEALFGRYDNTNIQHKTWQIAMDGSQKLPQRLLETIGENLKLGRVPKGLTLAVAAWMQYTSGRDLEGGAIDVRDPMANVLAACWDTQDVVGAYLAIEAIFPPEMARNSAFIGALNEALASLKEHGSEGAAALISA